MQSIMFRRSIVLGTLLVAAAPVSAQSFNQAIVFGDSTVDSGYYREQTILQPGFVPGGGTNYNNDWPTGVAHGAGKPTTSPGGMYSEALASFFGLEALPSNTPGGGTDYATSGAKDALDFAATGDDFKQAIPTTTQIETYLAANGGRANPNALYLISSGGNDVAHALGLATADQIPYLVNDAINPLVDEVSKLHQLGAKYIVVPDLPYSLNNNPDVNALRKFYSQSLWSDLATAGVNFVPADINAVRLAIRDDFNSGVHAFGFDFIDTGHPACQFNPLYTGDPVIKPVSSASALLCSSDLQAPYTFAPGDDLTHLFADDQHLATAGQKIMADYMYSLIVAPSEISFLPENAVKARTQSIFTIRNQIEASQQQRGPLGLNSWVTGDISRLKIDNPYNGFPDDPGNPAALTAGVDYKWPNGVVTGVAVAYERQKSDFSLGGDFTQRDVAGSLYAAYAQGRFWGSVIGTYGKLDYDVNRLVPIGITVQANDGSTDGHNLSAALEGGYKFTNDGLTHGPVLGFTWQRAEVGGFTESGSFTSLSFGNQTRGSEISELGYRVSAKIDEWHPFAQLVWNHEFNGEDRSVTASLTTVDFAPSFSMPALPWAATGARFNLALRSSLCQR